MLKREILDVHIFAKSDRELKACGKIILADKKWHA